MKSLSIAILLFLFSGCSTTTPAVSTYRLVPTMSDEAVSAKRCQSKSLQVAQLFSTTALKTTKMHYVMNNYEELAFNQSEWAESPAKELSQLLVESIAKSHLFSSVSGYRSRAKRDYILEGNLEEFEQYFNKDATKSFVKVRIRLRLIEKKSAKILRTDTIIVEKKSDSLDAEGGVKALNLSLGTLLKDTNRWLGEACK